MELFWWLFDDCAFCCRLIGTIRAGAPGTTIISRCDHFIGLCSARTRALAGAQPSIGAGAAYARVVRARRSCRLFWAQNISADKKGCIRSDPWCSRWPLLRNHWFVCRSSDRAVAGEFIGGKRMIDAGRAGWGSLLGNVGAMWRN